MLTFNPKRRITVPQALAHPFFHGVGKVNGWEGGWVGGEEKIGMVSQWTARERAMVGFGEVGGWVGGGEEGAPTLEEIKQGMWEEVGRWAGKKVGGMKASDLARAF